MPQFFSEMFLLKFSRQAFLKKVLFLFSGKRGERSPPSRFANCPRSADHTPYLVELRSGAPRARVCQTELISFLLDEAARVFQGRAASL
jgi:hypothetical protein